MKALLIVDMQNDFMPWGTLPVPDADQLVPYIASLAESSEYVIASLDWHPPSHISFATTHNKAPYTCIQEGGVEQILWPDHCVMDTDGAALVEGIDPELVDEYILKGTHLDTDSYSAFFDNKKRYETPLFASCEKKGIDSLHVVGVALEYCVYYTVVDALELGLAVTVDLRGCKGIEKTPGDCQRVLADMKQKGASVLYETEE